MANNTNETQLSAEVKRQLEVLRNSPTIFNALDLIPSECTWYITAEDMERYVRKVAEEFLGREEIRFVTIEGSLKGSRAPHAYIWLRKDSKHLVSDRNRNVNANNMVMNPVIEQYSEELKRFADRFAPTHRDDGTEISRKKRIRLLDNGERDKNIKAMPVDLSRILERIFDSENRGFQDAYGSDRPARRCRIDVSCKYRKNDERNALLGFKVVKSLEGARGGRPNNRPIVSFSERRSYDD